MKKVLLHRIAFLTFGTMFASPCLAGEVDASLDPFYISPRTNHLCPPSASGNYRIALTNAIVGSTPQEKMKDCGGNYDPTRVSFDVDQNGCISNLKLAYASGLMDRDFWTVYAVVSCPPIKPYEGLNAPVHEEIGNKISRTVTTVDAEENRLALQQAVPRSRASEEIFFPLIPVSVMALSKSFTIEEICQKKNIVCIPKSCLLNNSEKVWDTNYLNELIDGNSLVAKFLAEWPQFYRKNPSPSKKEILAFADKLRSKYKSLLKEGKP